MGRLRVEAIASIVKLTSRCDVVELGPSVISFGRVRMVARYPRLEELHVVGLEDAPNNC